MRCSQQAINSANAWSNFRLSYALHRLHIATKAYDPDQPRAPVGTEEAGQWISAGEGENFTIAGGFKKDELNLTVQDFIAKAFKGGIYGELPSQFLDYSLKELIEAKRAGVADANKCFKILHQDRFRK